MSPIFPLMGKRCYYFFTKHVDDEGGGGQIGRCSHCHSPCLTKRDAWSAIELVADNSYCSCFDYSNDNRAKGHTSSIKLYRYVFVSSLRDHEDSD